MVAAVVVAVAAVVVFVSLCVDVTDLHSSRRLSPTATVAAAESRERERQETAAAAAAAAVLVCSCVCWCASVSLYANMRVFVCRYACVLRMLVCAVPV